MPQTHLQDIKKSHSKLQDRQTKILHKHHMKSKHHDKTDNESVKKLPNWQVVLKFCITIMEFDIAMKTEWMKKLGRKK
ncbi:10019_t:CDS:2, partial [Acaulospora morrowiae]